MNEPRMNLTVVTPIEIALAEHAAVIRALGKRVVGDVIEIGRRLAEAKALAGHGHWLPWLDREFGWSEQTALNFMRVHELGLKSKTVLDLDLPMRSFYLLAAPSTPAAVVEEVIGGSANGETFTHKDIQKLIAEAKVAGAAEIEATLAGNLAAAQTAVANLRREYEARGAQIELLKSDLAGAMTVDQGRAAIEEALLPLKRKIEDYEAKIERMKRRRPAPQSQQQHEFGLRAQVIRSAIAHLNEALVITPAQFVQAAQFVSTTTGQSLKVVLSAEITNARNIAAWIAQFVNLEECQ